MSFLRVLDAQSHVRRWLGTLLGLGLIRNTEEGESPLLPNGKCQKNSRVKKICILNNIVSVKSAELGKCYGDVTECSCLRKYWSTFKGFWIKSTYMEKEREWQCNVATLGSWINTRNCLDPHFLHTRKIIPQVSQLAYILQLKVFYMDNSTESHSPSTCMESHCKTDPRKERWTYSSRPCFASYQFNWVP